MIWSAEHQPFLDAILSNPQNKSALLFYADWLEENGDARAEYIRLQLAFRQSRTEALQRRLFKLYPYEHQAWVGLLELAGVLEGNLLDIPFAWRGTPLSLSKLGEVEEGVPYCQQPPLPIEAYDGSFAWLKDAKPESSYSLASLWQKFCTQQRTNGYFVPQEFENFMTSADLPCKFADKYEIGFFMEPPEIYYPYSMPYFKSNDGLLVGFCWEGDGLGTHLWAIFLPHKSGRCTPILSGSPERIFPKFYGRRNHHKDDSDDYTIAPAFVASQFNQFLFRYWIENKIADALNSKKNNQNLTSMEQIYYEHWLRLKTEQEQNSKRDP